MQQRRLRLGDILDDYCPRERRITNHVVVAMIDDEVKQTRCTTCDADHEYKQAKAPAPRRRKPDAALVGDIEGTLRPRPAATAEEHALEPELEEHEPESESAGPIEVPMLVGGVDPEGDVDVDADLDDDDNVGNRAVDDEGPVHRRLIRATLPRQEGQVPERKAPDFTIRQPGGRGGRDFDGNKVGYRPGGAGGPGGGRGRRPMRTQGASGQPPRFGGPRNGAGPGGPRHGSGQGQRPGGNRPSGGHPGNRGGGRPPGQGRGPGGGRKRGR